MVVLIEIFVCYSQLFFSLFLFLLSSVVKRVDVLSGKVISDCANFKERNIFNTVSCPVSFSVKKSSFSSEIFFDSSF